LAENDLRNIKKSEFECDDGEIMSERGQIKRNADARDGRKRGACRILKRRKYIIEYHEKLKNIISDNSIKNPQIGFWICIANWKFEQISKLSVYDGEIGSCI
jgi:hypothetical protein